jgi:imidazolonepropionase
MPGALAVLNCSQLVTLQGPPGPRTGPAMRELGIIRHGAMIVEDGILRATGTRTEIEPLIPREAEVLDAGGRVILPGFVDAHTHAVFAGHRANEFEMRIAGASYQEIAASGGGIRSTVRLTRAATEDELFQSASHRLPWFLAGGTTTLEIKSGYGLSLEDECKMLRVIRRLRESTPLDIVATFLGAHEVPDEYRHAPQEYLRVVIEEMIPTVARENLAEYCDVFCEDHVFTVEQAREVLTAARRHGLRARVHADQLANTGGAAMAAQVGAATADHLEHIDDDGIAALGDSGVQPILLPASVYALGLRRYPPARQMIDAGLAVVVASDFNPGSSPVPSMPLIISLACTQMRMTPAEAITAATVNAAHSLDRSKETGSLEPGKYANFTIFDAADYREIAYWAGAPLTWRVYIRGRLTYRAGLAM